MDKKINPMKDLHLVAHPELDESGATYLREPGDQSPGIVFGLDPELANELASRWNSHPWLQARIEELESFIRKHHPHAPQCAVVLEPVLAENFCSCGRYALLTPNTGTDGQEDR